MTRTRNALMGLLLMGLTATAMTAEIKPRPLSFWADRVIPLPREMSVKKSFQTTADRVKVIYKGDHVPPVSAALWELGTKALCQEKEPAVVIRLALTEDADIADELAERLAALPNKDQAYAIVSDPKDDRLEIQIVANKPLGLMYGARTLSMLVRPWEPKQLLLTAFPAAMEPELMEQVDEVCPITRLEVPEVNIVDWPDIAERGLWGSYLENYIPWFAKWKLNLLGYARWGSSGLSADGKPYFDPNVRKIVEKGMEMGVEIVPHMTHLEQISLPSGALGSIVKREGDKIVIPDKKLEHLRPLLVMTRHGYCPLKFDFSKPAAIDMLTEFLLQEAAIVSGTHDKMDLWLSETACPGMDDGDRDQYEIEMAAVLTAFDRVKKRYPDVKLRICLTQGSFPVTDKVMKMTPKDVALLHYSGSIYGQKGLDSGSCTYITDHFPMIPPLFEKFAKNGGMMGVVPQLTDHFDVVVPWTAPQFIQFRCREFADKGLFSIYGFAVPTPKHHVFNIMATAEWSWNAHGRSPKDFSRAYATVIGLKNPSLFAEWAEKAGETGWELASSKFISSLSLNPTAGLLGGTPFDKMFPYRPLTDEKSMAKLLATAREALALAKRSGFQDMIWESEFTLAGLKAFDLLNRISKLSRSMTLDAAGKAELAAALNELDATANAVARSLTAWNDAKTRGNGLHNGGERFLRPAMMLLYAADLARDLTAPLKISDSRPRFRPLELRRIVPSDYKNGKTNLQIDVTGLFPKEGGDYQVVFNGLDGDCGTVYKLDLVGEKVDGTKTILAQSPEAFANFCYSAKIGAFAECRLSVPDIGDYRALYLDIGIGAAGDKGGTGLIGLRQVWDPSVFPAATASWPAEAVERIEMRKKAAATTAAATRDAFAGFHGVKVGVTPGYASDALVAFLNARPGVKAALVTPNAETLKGLNVLIVTQAKGVPGQLIRSSKDIVGWVENGGGAMFLHDAVGYRAHMAMFKALGQGVIHPKVDKVRVAKAHPVVDGVAPETVFSPGFACDHVVMTPGAAGDIVIRSEEPEKRPVLIAGNVGAGRVVLNGMIPGLKTPNNATSNATDAAPEGPEKQIFLNSVSWLANRSVAK